MSKQSGLMPVTEAMAAIMAGVQCDWSLEILPLYAVQGRVLAQDLQAFMDVPPADNSAMDGYALRMSDLEMDVVPISQRIAAGQAPKALSVGTCARLFTGAEVPEGAELIVMQEQTEIVDGGIRILGEHHLGAFIRRAGQDIEQGEKVLSKGTLISPRHMGMLASMGIAEVEVYRRLKVAVISTGSELLDPGQPLSAGKIYNSNRYQLAGLLAQLDMELVDVGIIEDDPQATKDGLLQAAKSADVVITSGGVSVGEEDYVKTSVEALGALSLWKLAIKPGKPLAFGHIQGTPFFGLPGNPASVLVTFLVMARPYLLAMQGVTDKPLRPLPAQLVNPPDRPSVRQEYLRARIVGSAQGMLQVKAMTNQNSGVLSTAMHGDGLAIVPIGASGDEASQIEFLMF